MSETQSQTDQGATAWPATPPNPWMLALWWIGALGTLIGGSMVIAGLNDALTSDVVQGGTDGPSVVVAAGAPILAASLVALVVVIALHARAWDRAKGR